MCIRDSICTAQALLANIAGFYACYHGSEGLKKIATRILKYRQVLIKAFKFTGTAVDDSEGFDTIRIKTNKKVDEFNMRYENGFVVFSIDELTSLDEMQRILDATAERQIDIRKVFESTETYKWFTIPERNKPWLTQEAVSYTHLTLPTKRIV